jgi:hypothetical protein
MDIFFISFDNQFFGKGPSKKLILKNIVLIYLKTRVYIFQNGKGYFWQEEESPFY